MSCDVLNGQQDTGHEGAAVHRIVPDRQGLPQPAKDDFLMGDEPTRSYRVHPDVIY